MEIGCKRPADSTLQAGFFLEPTVLTKVKSGKIWREEVFGPVVTVTPFHDETEALRWPTTPCTG